MMSAPKFIIIGNGPAGLEAAITLKEKAPDARLTIISRDPHESYRPKLLPDYIAGQIDRSALMARPFSWYDQIGARLRVGQTAVRLDLHAREVLLDHHERLAFDGLILAVGGQPRIPEPYWVFRDLMLPLKTMADADQWIDRLKDVDDVLIVGGDLTGFAVVRALLALNKKVRFVFGEEALWPTRPTPEIFRQAADRLIRRGVEVVPGKLRRIVRETDGALAVTTTEAQTSAGLVGAFFGLAPDVAFLAESGLAIERGVLVDEHLYAGFPGVYAAGDCAQVYHPQIRDYWVSIGYENARALGRIAALNLAGGLERVNVAAESIFDDDGIRVNTSWWMEFGS
jgi:NADPH-dependent 2,4-dienoyl-CoA reductase/sulfur reductase-like enzyme